MAKTWHLSHSLPLSFTSSYETREFPPNDAATPPSSSSIASSPPSYRPTCLHPAKATHFPTWTSGSCLLQHLTTSPDNPWPLSPWNFLRASGAWWWWASRDRCVADGSSFTGILENRGVGGDWPAGVGGQSLPCPSYFVYMCSYNDIFQTLQFTPGCSRSHVPGFLEAAKDLRAKGIDQVYVVSTADGRSEENIENIAYNEDAYHGSSHIHLISVSYTKYM